jgi:5-methylcytosine-specific restriction endonuclease McrA
MAFKTRTKEIKRGLCGCGKPVTYQGYTKKGFKIWKTGCAACEKRALRHRKKFCESCGATKKLQIDHIDGDRSNNDPSNLKTLCHPCHINKTTENNEWRHGNENLHTM